MMRIDVMRFAPALALSACALVVSGCGGGGQTGSGITLPAAPSPTPKPGASSQAKATATFTITIPKAATATANTTSSRHRLYVSAATQSIGITQAPQGGTAGAPTIVNVASAACVPASTGTTCSVGIQAQIGTDTFTVTTYDQANLAGNVLSTGTVTGTVVAGHANAFPLVLGGTVASIVLTPATPNLPAGESGTSTVAIAAYDADKNEIIGTYATPIALSAPAGLTLSIASIASSSTATFTASYDGASRTALPITATSGAANGSAPIVPTTNVIYYTLPGTTENDPFKIVRGPDGAFYFGEIYGFINNITDQPTTLPGRIGRIDENGTYSEVQLNYEDPIGLLFVGNDLYVAEQTSSVVSRIANAGAGGFSATNLTDVLMPKNPGNIEGNQGVLDEPRTLALGPDGNVYVTNYTAGDIAYFNPATFGSGTITEIPTAPVGAAPIGLALGANGMFYATTFNYQTISANVIDTFAPGATSTTAMTPTNATTNVPPLYRYITAASDGNLYFTENDADQSVPNASGRISRYDLATGSSTTIAEPAPFEQPDSVERGATGTVLFNDPSNEAIGIVQTSNLSAAVYPFIDAFDGSATFPNDVATDTDGSYWFTAPSFAAGDSETSLSYTSKIAHFIPAQGWTLYPNVSTLDVDGLGPYGAILLGVAAASTAGSTFTATSSNPSVCTVTQPAGFTVNFVLTGVSNGTCTISVTDGVRTVTKTVDVTSSTATISARRRRVVRQ